MKNEKHDACNHLYGIIQLPFLIVSMKNILALSISRWIQLFDFLLSYQCLKIILNETFAFLMSCFYTLIRLLNVLLSDSTENWIKEGVKFSPQNANSSLKHSRTQDQFIEEITVPNYNIHIHKNYAFLHTVSLQIDSITTADFTVTCLTGEGR